MEERERKRGGGEFTFGNFNLKSLAVQWGVFATYVLVYVAH